MDSYLEVLPSLYAIILLYSAIIFILALTSLTLGTSIVFHLYIIADLAASKICVAIDLTAFGNNDILVPSIACSMFGFEDRVKCLTKGAWLAGAVYGRSLKELLSAKGH